MRVNQWATSYLSCNDPRLHFGLGDAEIEQLYENYRPLGACSGYIWNDIRRHADGDIDKMLKFIEIIPVPLTESLGTVTGKYPAKDKITSSAVDLLGEESIQRLLHISDPSNPYRFDLQRPCPCRIVPKIRKAHPAYKSTEIINHYIECSEKNYYQNMVLFLRRST